MYLSSDFGHCLGKQVKEWLKPWDNPCKEAHQLLNTGKKFEGEEGGRRGRKGEEGGEGGGGGGEGGRGGCTNS